MRHELLRHDFAPEEPYGAERAVGGEGGSAGRPSSAVMGLIGSRDRGAFGAFLGGDDRPRPGSLVGLLVTVL